MLRKFFIDFCFGFHVVYSFLKQFIQWVKLWYFLFLVKASLRCDFFDCQHDVLQNKVLKL